MRLVAYTDAGVPGVGVLGADGTTVECLEVDRASAGAGVLPLVESLAMGGSLPAVRGTADLSRIVLRAPIPRPRRNIFCVGKNYFDHAQEFARSGFDSSAASGAVPDAPIIFSKVPECVIASGEAVEMDGALTSAVDYEAELAVIIGRGGRGIDRSAAMQHVWGFTTVNDVTARDLQGRHRQWLIGKSLDTFCPMGPLAASRDEVDLETGAIRCWVNGELRQDALLKQLIFDVPTLIETLSAGITLYPGDLIATGTPAGVGIGFDPPRYLQPGDRVRVEIDGLGTLENPFVARSGNTREGA